MHALDCKLNLVEILVLLILAVALPLPARAQGSPVANQVNEFGEPADGWQRGLEIGGLAATFLTLGCGKQLLGRQERSDLGDAYDRNRYWHLSLGGMAVGINLASGWQQWEINRKRTRFEFRHIAHNALFWANMAGVVASAALGIASTQTRANGDLQAAHSLAVAMEAAGFASLGVALTDVALFGGHDNATIIGYKLAF
jgi:hypothetical protein